jgi:hypothetical protein
MSPFRIALLATLCAAIMCVAGAVQLLGVNRIVVDDGRIPAAATSLTGAADIGFKTDYFPLER